MPYMVRKQGEEWVVVKEVSPGKWKVKSHHDSKVKAEKQRRLLEGIRHGWTPTKK